MNIGSSSSENVEQPSQLEVHRGISSDTINASVSIARAGQELGTWSATDIQKMLQAGVLTSEDQFWQEGMTEWSTLAYFVPSPSTMEVVPQVCTENTQQVEAEETRLHELGFAENPAALGRAQSAARHGRLLSVGLCLLTLIFVGRWMISRSKSNPTNIIAGKQAAPTKPDQAIYDRLLAQTHAVVEPESTIIIDDSNGATLSLKIDYFKDADHRPEIPLQYHFEYSYDDIAFLRQDDTHHSKSVEDNGMKFIPTAKQELRNAFDPSLSEALDKLVEWSVADAQPGANPRYDLAASGKSNTYFVRCEPAKGYFYLIVRHQNQLFSPQAMQTATELGYVSPVTNFARAHLWRYLIDHYGEIRQLTESHLSAKRNELPKVNGK